MKKRNQKSSSSLSSQQLAQAGGGYWGCDVFGAGVGLATSEALTPLGGAAAGLGASWACNYVVDNWGSGYSGGGMDDNLWFGVP